MDVHDKSIDQSFEALAHPLRRSIVQAVSLCPRSISSLATEFGYSLPAIHKHIDQLEEAQIIMRRKVGRTNYLSINRNGLLVAQKWLGQFHIYWGSNAESLENYHEQLNKQE